MKAVILFLLTKVFMTFRSSAHFDDFFSDFFFIFPSLYCFSRMLYGVFSSTDFYDLILLSKHLYDFSKLNFYDFLFVSDLCRII